MSSQTRIDRNYDICILLSGKEKDKLYRIEHKNDLTHFINRLVRKIIMDFDDNKTYSDFHTIQPSDNYLKIGFSSEKTQVCQHCPKPNHNSDQSNVFEEQYMVLLEVGYWLCGDCDVKRRKEGQVF